MQPQRIGERVGGAGKGRGKIDCIGGPVMESFGIRAEGMQDPDKKYVSQGVKPDSDIIISQLMTLPLHSKLVLCACVKLFSNDAKITVTDVFTKYKQLTARFNINWLYLSKVTEHIKELEMLGFLKCTYPPKGQGHQIRYVHIFEPAEIPRYVSILQEELEKGRICS